MIMYEGKDRQRVCKRQTRPGWQREKERRSGECLFWMGCRIVSTLVASPPGWVQLRRQSLSGPPPAPPTPPPPTTTVTCHWTTAARTHAHTAQPFSLTEPLAHWAQLVPEPTLGLHIWCQRSVRGRPSVWIEGEIVGRKGTVKGV